MNNKGRLIFYKSNDLKKWSYLNFSEKENFGWMWECPDYFEVDGNGVIVFSPMGFINDGKKYDSASVCMLSKFDEMSGTINLPYEYSFFDYGLDLYAPQSTTDKDGNRIVIAWVRMPQAVNDKWNGMMCIPRIIEVKNNHIYFRPHTNVKDAFTKKISSPEKSGYMVKTSLKNGESINIGGYIIKREDDKIKTDRSDVFVKNGNYRLTAETPVLKDGYNLEIYVDENLIEIFINDGEYVISNVVYGLSDTIIGEEYTLYTIEEE